MVNERKEERMRAVLVKAPGGPEQLEMGTYEKPVPGPSEVLVRVAATALNRADLLQREGRYPPAAGESPLLGLEMAGVVEAVGRDVKRWAPGDRVCSLLGGGGYAAYVAVHEDLAMVVPPLFSMQEAAAVPEVFLTAFQALHWIARMAAGEHVLVHAGASGVGTAAIQLVRAAGAHAYVTASAGKHDLCRDLGAELAVDYRTEDFAARVREATGGHGADVVVDFIGAPYLVQNVDVLAQDGRIVVLAMMGGAAVDRFDLRPLFRKRGQITASTLRSRSLAYKIRLTKAFVEYATPHFTDGTLRAVVDRVFDWTDVAEAHRYMGENRNAGKIVLRVNT